MTPDEPNADSGPAAPPPDTGSSDKAPLENAPSQPQEAEAPAAMQAAAYRTRSSSEVLFVEALHVAIRRGRKAFIGHLLTRRAADQVGALDNSIKSETTLSAPDVELLALGVAREVAVTQAAEFAKVDLEAASSEEVLRQADLLVAPFARTVSELGTGVQESIDRYLERRHRELVVRGAVAGENTKLATEVEAQKVHPDAMVGLALSGGGIRSASFALGAVESSCTWDLLPGVDFISSVSGGGYAASWLTAWSYRHRKGVVGVQEELLPIEVAKAGPLRWIRRHCAYLAPRLTSPTSSDVWALVVAYATNWLPVLALLCLAMVSLLLFPNAIMITTAYLRDAAPSDWQHLWRTLFAVCAVAAGVLFATGLRRLTSYYRIPGKKTRYPHFVPELVFYGTLVSGVLLSLTLPWVWSMRVQDITAGAPTDRSTWFRLFFETLGVLLVLVMSSSLLARLVSKRWAERLLDWSRGQLGAVMAEGGLLVRRKIPFLARVGAALLSAVFGAGFFTVMAWACVRYALPVEVIVALGPLAVVLAFGVAEIVGFFVTHEYQHDRDRAWTARVGAWLLSSACAWALLCLVAFGIDPLMQRLAEGLLLWGVGAVLVLAAYCLWRYLGLIGPVLMLVAVAFLVCLVKFVLVPVLLLLRDVPGAPVWSDQITFIWPTLLVAWLLTWIVSAWSNANRFSLHAVYKEGLVRTFLGASRLGPLNLNVGAPTHPEPAERELPQFQTRRPDPVTNIDDEDDPALSWMKSVPDREVPILLLNAALNGRSRTDLEGRVPRQWPFTFSQYFCGSPATGVGYGETGAFGGVNKTKGLTLGTAMAVSGAAMSPTSGRSTHPVKAMILGILNARLGMWIGNPQSPTAVKTSGPNLAGITVVREVLGIRDKFDDWVHLSDGGHFENLGVYELLRRGCMRIIAVDASCDPDRGYADLANAIRRARIDLGIQVIRQGAWDMPSPRQQPRKSRKAARAWTWFSIIYGEGLPVGRLLYVKPFVDADAPLPVEVRNYWHAHPAFPHETTADQFFTEAQMEAYRSLGRWCMETALETALSTEATKQPWDQDPNGLFEVFKRQSRERATEERASVGPPPPPVSPVAVGT